MEKRVGWRKRKKRSGTLTFTLRDPAYVVFSLLDVLQG